MTAEALVRRLESRGVRLGLAGHAGVSVDPAGILTDDEKAQIRENKLMVREYLISRELPALLRVRLDQLDRVLEVVVPWADHRLLIVPGCRLARLLRETDPMPGRVWCVCEVLNLLLAGVKPAQARDVAEVKVCLGGSVQAVQHEVTA